MKFYHVTRRQTAHEIEQQGFKDAQGCSADEQPVRGVWVAARPLIAECGFEDAAVFELDLPEDGLRQYALPRDPKGYRQWCVPASLVNGVPRRRLTKDAVKTLQTAQQRSASSSQA